MKLLITGSSGFLGSHLISHCGDWYTVAGMERNAGRFGGVEVYSSAETERIDFEPDAVVMCHAEIAAGGRAKTHEAYFESNVRLTERLCKRFPDAFIVYVSTVSVYSSSGGRFTESSPCSPSSAYTISKYWGEKVAAAHGNAAILRVSSLYGPGMKDGTLISNYIRQARTHGEIVVWGNGGRMQNYLHVSDAVGYVLAMLERPAASVGKILLGTGPGEHSNREVAAMTAHLANARLRFVKQDPSPSCRYDNSVTRTITGYQPSVRLAAGLAEIVSSAIPAGLGNTGWRKRLFAKSARWCVAGKISLSGDFLDFFAFGLRCFGCA